MIVKSGTKFVVIRGPFPGTANYAIKGWTGKILREYDDKKFVVKWDKELRGGDLVYKKDIQLIDYKKVIKVFPIVDFMRNFKVDEIGIQNAIKGE